MQKKFNNIRVQVSLSVDMCDKVDKLAYSLGVSRSSLCSVLIGQGMMSFEKGFEIVQNTFNEDFIEKLLNDEVSEKEKIETSEEENKND